MIALLRHMRYVLAENPVTLVAFAMFAVLVLAADAARRRALWLHRPRLRSDIRRHDVRGGRGLHGERDA